MLYYLISTSFEVVFSCIGKMVRCCTTGQNNSPVLRGRGSDIRDEDKTADKYFDLFSETSYILPIPILFCAKTVSKLFWCLLEP